MSDSVRYILLPGLIGALVGLLVIFVASRGESDGGHANAVARATPAVVNIYTASIMQPPICDIPRYKEWCEAFARRGGGRRSSSLGSGVIVRSDGYILTNNHVVAEADEVLVAFHNGQATPAAVVGTDPETDLALLRVEANSLPAIDTGHSSDVRVGDIALAIGNPFGFGQTVSAGIISAKGRVGITNSPYNDFLQTDAAINPGNSGGALIDATGLLIGVNTLIFSRSGGSEGIGFAIPVDTAMAVVDDLVREGRVVRGWLGIDLVRNPPPGQGLRVNAVLNGGPANLAGVRVGDSLLAVDGRDVTSPTQVGQQIAAAAPGTRVRLSLQRGDQTVSLDAEVTARPSSSTR